MAVLKLVNVSRAAAARITTGVSHRLRSFEGARSKEGESTDDIAKAPRMMRMAVTPCSVDAFAPNRGGWSSRMTLRQRNYIRFEPTFEDTLSLRRFFCLAS
jgi:hypothetical protein